MGRPDTNLSQHVWLLLSAQPRPSYTLTAHVAGALLLTGLIAVPGAAQEPLPADPVVSTPTETTPEGDPAGCEESDDTDVVARQERADLQRDFVDVTAVTVAEALAIASEHWDARETAFLDALEGRVAALPTDAPTPPAGSRAPGVETCRMLAGPDLGSCDQEKDAATRSACYALKMALSAPARVPSVCVLAPAAMQASCRLVFGGDTAPCKAATGEAAASCASLLGVAGREGALCGAELEPGRCLDALLVAGLRLGEVVCEQALTPDRDDPQRRVLRDQCRAILRTAPEQCPADANPTPLRSEGSALVRASFGVGWVTLAAGANAPAVCAVKATIYEGEDPLRTELATVFTAGAGLVDQRSRRLSHEIHASRTVVGVVHACAPTVSWRAVEQL